MGVVTLELFTKVIYFCKTSFRFKVNFTMDTFESFDIYHYVDLSSNLGKWRGTVDVAIKQLKNMDENRMIGRRAIDGFQKAREEFFKESHILRILHHPHLVQVNLKPIYINPRLYKVLKGDI